MLNVLSDMDIKSAPVTADLMTKCNKNAKLILRAKVNGRATANGKFLNCLSDLNIVIKRPAYRLFPKKSKPKITFCNKYLSFDKI